MTWLGSDCASRFLHVSLKCSIYVTKLEYFQSFVCVCVWGGVVVLHFLLPRLEGVDFVEATNSAHYELC